MKRILHIALMLLPLLAAGEARAQKYQKFLETKGLESARSFLNIYAQEEKIFLEFPDSVTGRRVLLTSVIRSSSNPSIMEGTDISSGQAFLIGRTDSLVLLLRPSDPVKGTDAIEIALPIHCYSPDSSSVVVKADKLFDPDWKAVANFKGQRYGDHSILSASRKSELSSFKGLRAYPRSVGILRELTYGIKLASILGGELAGDYSFTGSVETCLTLLPEHKVKPLKADSRIGTRSIQRFRADSLSGGIQTDRLVARWKLDGGEHITLWVDTLLAEPWNSAVRAGLLEWNNAFEAAGLGQVIEVHAYPGKDFNAGDPLVSTVSLGRGSAVSASLNTDPQSGEILSCKLHIPTDFVSSVRKKGMVQISDVDARYRCYELPQDAVAEALKARTLSTFGLCLGLTRNMAGSYAYSPSQLRDPAFTQEQGISASVTDDVLYNILARPGDRERGVVLVSDRLGAYDRYAIRWIYDEHLDRKAWLEDHSGQAAFLYLPQNNANSDPRGLTGDLGNDPIEMYTTHIARQQWIAANAAGWIGGDEVHSSFKDLFADYIFLEAFYISRALLAQVGGMYVGDRREGSTEPKYTAVPERLQKEVLRRIVHDWMDFTWMDTHKDLLTLAGANANVSSFTRMTCWNDLRPVQRFPYLVMSEEVAGNTYSLEKALQDIEDELMRNIRSGKALRPGEELLVASYANSLVQQSPLLTARAKEASGQSFNVTQVPESYTVNLEEPCYRALVHLQESVKKAARHYKGQEKGRIAYLESFIDNALKGKQ